MAASVADRLSPPQLLAEMLREDRERGFAFEDVFAEDAVLRPAATAAGARR
jgi:hypothetical protein